jgi:hypothetical protein
MLYNFLSFQVNSVEFHHITVEIYENVALSTAETHTVVAL